MYFEGQGVEKSIREALRWFHKAAQEQQPLAQRMLGSIYETGKGVEKDFCEAYAWFNLAASNGDEDAAELRDELEKKLSSSIVAEAQKRTKVLKQLIEEKQLGSFPDGESSEKSR